MSAKTTTKERIIGIIAHNLKCSREAVVAAGNLSTDLNMDSLDEICIAVEMEKEFDVSFPDSKLGDIKTLEGFINLIPV